MQDFLFLLMQIGAIFLAFLIGYIVRRFRGNKIDLNTLTEVIIYIGSPCLAFSTIVATDYQLRELALLLGAMAFFIFGMGALFMGYGFLTKKKTDSVIPISTMFMNTANIGFPVTLFVFGQQAFEKAVILDLGMVLILFSFGVGVLSKKYTAWLGMPVLYTALIAFIFSLSHMHFPEALLRPISLMGQITVPAMIISLGCKIADIQALGKFSLRLPILVSLIRVFGGMLLGLLFIGLFGLSGMTAAVVLLYATLPAPIMSYVLAQKYHRNEALAAEIVLVSNLGALATLPIILYISKSLFL